MTTHTVAAGVDTRLLGIYLNDHLAGAQGGVELARRLASAARRTGSPDAGELERARVAIEQDRAALLEVMRRLEVPVRRYKAAGAWLAERVGRLKPNGRLIRRSPLSHLVELEALHLGVTGKRALWQVLRQLADRDDRIDGGKIDALHARAREQDSTLEQLRRRAAETAFGRG